MQALDRIFFSQDWITVVFILGLILLVVLKTLNQKKLKEQYRSFFLKGFVEKKTEEMTSFFSLFNLLIFVFTTLVISLSITLIIKDSPLNNSITFFFYLKNFSLTALYLILFLGIDFLLSALFEAKTILNYIIVAKINYLFSSALWVFPVLILTAYGLENTSLLKGLIMALFILSIVLVFINNKKLIVRKLFYFILYICTLEIAPIVIFYKTTI